MVVKSILRSVEETSVDSDCKRFDSLGAVDNPAPGCLRSPPRSSVISMPLTYDKDWQHILILNGFSQYEVIRGQIQKAGVADKHVQSYEQVQI